MADDEEPAVRKVLEAMFWWPEEAAAFDPLDYETWPQTLRDLSGEIADGLDNGDLVALAAHLRKGFPVPFWLSVKIADAIDPEGNGRFHIKAVGRKKGETGEKAASVRYARNANIGAYVAYYIHKHGEGSYDAAIADARDKFDLGSKSSAPAQHYSNFRAKAFRDDGSIHPYYVTYFNDLMWKHYPFKRSD